MRIFNVGDRVQVVGKRGQYTNPELLGKEAIITENWSGLARLSIEGKIIHPNRLRKFTKEKFLLWKLEN